MATPAPPPFDTETYALFLDFDGTLVPFHQDPDKVALPDGGIALLRNLEDSLQGALALVTGRRLAALDGFVSPLAPAAGGLHGLEFRERAGGKVAEQAISDQVAVALRRLQPLVAVVPGLRLEDKAGALVVHFRGVPELAERAGAIARQAAADLHELCVVPGNAIYEIRMAGIDKGQIVDRFMAREPFRGRWPVFIGDDRTDEDGFAAARALGGYGIKVGPGETGAAYRLADVDAVHAHLAAAVKNAAAAARTAAAGG